MFYLLIVLCLFFFSSFLEGRTVFGIFRLELHLKTKSSTLPKDEAQIADCTSQAQAKDMNPQCLTCRPQGRTKKGTGFPA